MERHEVLQKACDYLARREHSRRELERKLSQGCDDSGLVDELLTKLAEQGLQSDARFAENFVHHRYHKGQGPAKIRQELSQRGVTPDIIELCLRNDSFDWYQNCSDVRRKRFGEELPNVLKDKAKQSRFLYSRGFDSEMIQYALEKQND